MNQEQEQEKEHQIYLSKNTPYKTVLTKDAMDNAKDKQWKSHKVPNCTNREYPKVLSKIIESCGFEATEYREIREEQ